MSIRRRSAEVDGLENRSRAGLGEHIGRRRQDRVERGDVDGDVGVVGAEGEDAVPVVHRVGGADRPCQPVVGDVGQFGAPSFVERCIGGHDTDGRVEVRARARPIRENFGELTASPSRGFAHDPTAEMPGQPRLGIDDRADGVDDGESGDDVSIGGSSTGGAHTPLKAPGSSACTRPDRPDGERSARPPARSISERGIGVILEGAGPPEIEDDRRRNDRDDPVGWLTESEASLHLVQTSHHTTGGIETECTSSGETDGIHVSNESVGAEKIGFTCSRSGTSNRHAPRGVRWRDDHGGAGSPSGRHTLVMTDGDSFDVGETTEWIFARDHMAILAVESTRRSIASLSAMNDGAAFIAPRRSLPSRVFDRLAHPIVVGVFEKVRRWGAIGPHSRRGRNFGSFGEGSIVCFPWSTIFNEHYVHIGRDTMIGPDCSISAGMVPGQKCLTERVVTIGDRCLIGKGSGIVGHFSIEIGDDVWTGHHVYITDQNHDYRDVSSPIGRQSMPEKPVRIGSGSWIGFGSVILPGADIGEHVVIGANSVVSGHVPAFSVAVGAPARVIRRWDGHEWTDVES